jgi:hypothetical protein
MIYFVYCAVRYEVQDFYFVCNIIYCTLQDARSFGVKIQDAVLHCTVLKRFKMFCKLYDITLYKR